MPPLPILRHDTINDFVEKTGGEKRKALLEILDLDALNGFRNLLRTAVGQAKAAREGASTRRREDEAALNSILGGAELVGHARAAPNAPTSRRSPAARRTLLPLACRARSPSLIA